MPIEFTPKRNFRNPLYEDKRASCNIYLDAKSQSYRMKDFGNEAFSGDCFWFAASMLGLDVRTDFKKVLATIIKDLNLNITIKFKGSPKRNVYTDKKNCVVSPLTKSVTTNVTERKRVFRLYEQPFKSEELSFGCIME